MFSKFSRLSRTAAAVLSGAVAASSAVAAVVVDFNLAPPGVTPVGGIVVSAIPMQVIAAGYLPAGNAQVVPPGAGVPPAFALQYARITRAGLSFDMVGASIVLGAPVQHVRFDFQYLAAGVKLKANGIPVAAPNFGAMGGMVIGGMLVTVIGPNSIRLDAVAAPALAQFDIAGVDVRIDNVKFW